MVICVRIVSFFSLAVIPLVLLLLRPVKCQIAAAVEPNITLPTKTITETLGSIEQIQTPLPEEVGAFDPGQQTVLPHLDESTDFAEVLENAAETENEEYCRDQPCYEDEDYEEFYDDSDDDSCCCKERTYGKLLLIGAAVLLVLGLFGIVCFTRTNDQESRSCPSVTTCFRYANPDDEKACIVNFVKASPDLSDSESDDHNMPLPLIYEDMGKICNNAEMFIQRCMTSSVKRTYSEPVKTITSSKTKFRDYIKELAYLKEKQHQECSKHGAVTAFFKEMFKMFRRSQLEEKWKRGSGDKVNKETRVKIEDSTKDLVKTIPKQIKSNKSNKRKERKSSSSISISSLLLKPQYQSKYYKKEHNYDTYKKRKKEAEKERNTYENPTIEEKMPLVINQKRPPQAEIKRIELAKEIRDQAVCPQDTEELIRLCVNSIRRPFTKKFVTLFDQNNLEQFNGLQDVAATMPNKIAVEDRRDRNIGDTLRLPRDPIQERNYCVPSGSRDVVAPIKSIQSKEALETFDLLVKQIYLMAAKNKNLQGEAGMISNRQDRGPGGDRVNIPEFPRQCANVTEEDSRSRMIKKYQELQAEVERLNRSLRQFADDFLYPEPRRPPLTNNQKQSENQQYRSQRKSKK